MLKPTKVMFWGLVTKWQFLFGVLLRRICIRNTKKDGYIQPTGLPKIYISGLTVENAEKI